MKIGIFCSANNKIAHQYFDMAKQLGEWMAQEGHTLVFGGCNSGLMECVGTAVHGAGGMTIGVIPSLIEKGGRVSESVDVEVPCDNLSDRKDLMIAQADVFIALPGGIGTLDELFTVAASRTIGYHNKCVILYNINGFWNPLIALLNAMKAQGMVRGEWADGIKVASNLDEIKDLVGKMG